MTRDRHLPYLPIPAHVSNTYLFSFLSFLLLLLSYLLPLSYLLFILSPCVLTLSVRVSSVTLRLGSEMDPCRRDLMNILLSYLVSDSFGPVLGARAWSCKTTKTTSAYHGSGILQKPLERDVSGCHPDF